MDARGCSQTILTDDSSQYWQMYMCWGHFVKWTFSNMKQETALEVLLTDVWSVQHSLDNYWKGLIHQCIKQNTCCPEMYILLQNLIFCKDNAKHLCVTFCEGLEAVGWPPMWWGLSYPPKRSTLPTTSGSSVWEPGLSHSLLLSLWRAPEKKRWEEEKRFRQREEEEQWGNKTKISSSHFYLSELRVLK